MKNLDVQLKGFLVYHVANIILLLLAQTVFNEWVFLSVLAGCFCFCSSLAALTMMSRTYTRMKRLLRSGQPLYPPDIVPVAHSSSQQSESEKSASQKAVTVS